GQGASDTKITSPLLDGYDSSNALQLTEANFLPSANLGEFVLHYDYPVLPNTSSDVTAALGSWSAQTTLAPPLSSFSGRTLVSDLNSIHVIRIPLTDSALRSSVRNSLALGNSLDYSTWIDFSSSDALNEGGSISLNVGGKESGFDNNAV